MSFESSPMLNMPDPSRGRCSHLTASSNGRVKQNSEQESKPCRASAVIRYTVKNDHVHSPSRTSIQSAPQRTRIPGGYSFVWRRSTMPVRALKTNATTASPKKMAETFSLIRWLNCIGSHARSALRGPARENDFRRGTRDHQPAGLSFQPGCIMDNEPFTAMTRRAAVWFAGRNSCRCRQLRGSNGLIRTPLQARTPMRRSEY